jgi:hypothetical protein
MTDATWQVFLTHGSAFASDQVQNCPNLHRHTTKEPFMPTPSRTTLLDFDTASLPAFSLSVALATLRSDRGPLYANHLLLAHWLDTQIAERTAAGPQARDGIDVLTDLAAKLRQGSFLDGAPLHDAEVDRLDRLATLSGGVSSTVHDASPSPLVIDQSRPLRLAEGA